MKNSKLSPKRAVWLGILGTPILLIAVIAAVSVAAAPAGQGQAAASDVASPPKTLPPGAAQSADAVNAYWTPARMAAAQPYPVPTSGESNHATGKQVTVEGPTGAPGQIEGFAPQATRGAGSSLPAAALNTSTEPQTEPYHGAIPFTRWELLGRFKTYPNSTVAKMFFTQDHDGNGTSSNFVCSAETVGTNDTVWTAGHCLNNALNGAGVFGGWSFNISVCPSYDNGVNPTVGCWGSVAGTGDQNYWVLTAFQQSGGGNQDMGSIDPADTGSVHATKIGNITGWLGATWNAARNQHWVALGYPQGAPFAGGKIIMAASSLGYTDDWLPGIASNAMGSDLTGGSSGGPWIVQYGLPGQVAGLGGNYLNGQNTWRHTSWPNEMASPYFDCRFVLLYNNASGSAIACP